MILVVAGTNRSGSRTLEVSREYVKLLKESTQEEVVLLPLCEVQDEMLHKNMYEGNMQSKILQEVQDKYFIPAKKWILISPEYNGSFPGVIKLLLDALSVRNAAETFHRKKVALVGISSGRTGNWLGMNQLTAILNYLKMHVFYNKLAVSHIENEINDEGILIREKTINFMKNQIQGFLAF